MGMLCRLLRTKTQKFDAFDNMKTQKLEQLYEGVYTEKRDLIKVHQRLKRDLSENKMELNRLQKQLTLKMNELEIERANQIKSSHDKSSMLRKKIHEKYGQKFSKKIEKE